MASSSGSSGENGYNADSNTSPRSSSGTVYSAAEEFREATNAAEIFDYDEFVSLLRHFVKAAYVGYDVAQDDKRWSLTTAQQNAAAIIRGLQKLIAALGAVKPPLRFIRKRGTERIQQDARKVLQRRLEQFSSEFAGFSGYATGQEFRKLKEFVKLRLLPDVEKLQRRHTRVFVTRNATARRISSDQEGGRRGKKLTRRRLTHRR
jgi:hypothetical protein